MEGTPKAHKGRRIWRSEDRVTNGWGRVGGDWWAVVVRDEAASELEIDHEWLEFPG